MRAEGIPVREITLLGAGLAQPNESPSDAIIEQWIETFGIPDPVLKDRGYGLSVMASLAVNETGEGFGYPTWVVLDPQTILAVNVGYSDWDGIEQIIRNELGRHSPAAQAGLRSPKSAVPTRTMVAPCATATSKSWLMPIDNSRRGSPCARPRAASSAMASNQRAASAGSSV